MNEGGEGVACGSYIVCAPLNRVVVSGQSAVAHDKSNMQSCHLVNDVETVDGSEVAD